MAAKKGKLVATVAGSDSLGKKKKKAVQVIKENGNKKLLKRSDINFLHGLCCLSDEHRSGLIDYLTDEGVDAISQCMLNCVFNKCIGGSKQAEICEKLGDKKHLFEYLARDTNSRAKKRKLLKQTGSGLPLVLSTVIPLLTALLAARKRKKKSVGDDSSSR
jgi:hypothetical protein